MSSNIGNKIKELREIFEITQSDLGAKIGVSKSMVSAYEKGIRNPSFKVLKSICEAFNVEESFFFEKGTQIYRQKVDITGLTPAQQKIIYALIDEFRNINQI